jgi:hypothetical protein
VYVVDERLNLIMRTTIVHYVADFDLIFMFRECQLLEASIKYSSQCSTDYFHSSSFNITKSYFMNL